MADFESRLTSLEQRLRRLEEANFPPPLKGTVPTASIAPAPAAAPSPPARQQSAGEARVGRTQEPVAATRILGWGGAIALVLAAMYLIRLAIDAGWFTPARQIALAIVGGVALIAAGLMLRRHNRQYAALLPGVGIVILYLSTYGAHLYYQMIPATTATGAVIAVSIASLWLGRVFGSSLYALFSVCGAYSTPLLLPVLRADVTDLIIYYTAWSVSFSLYSLWDGSRRTYMLAMYLALIGFDLIWRDSGAGNWTAAATYQLVQFLIFAGAAAAFSIRHRQPLDSANAWLHGFALLIFYFVEYALLDKHVPDLAPWIALASAAVLLVLYALSRLYLPADSQAGAVLVSAYAALVLFHAGYLESLPDQWTPWVALMLPTVLGLVLSRYAEMPRPARPFVFGVAIIFVFNYFRVIADVSMHAVPGDEWLRSIYAVALYVGYALATRVAILARFSHMLLYAAHLAAMVAAVDIFDSGISVSLAWAVLAVGSLLIAIQRQDRFLGQSSFLIFIASALKVLMFDLSGSAALTRVTTLIVLGISLYAGGWLYQKLVSTTVRYVDDPAVNRTINRVKWLLASETPLSQIAATLNREGISCAANRKGWTEAAVKSIADEYQLGQ